MLVNPSCLLIAGLATLLQAGSPLPYDPLRVTDQTLPAVLEETVPSESRKQPFPVCIQQPAEEGVYPVILFSHGLGGSRHNATYLANHWAKRGYVVICLQHPGSDESVWKGVNPGQRMSAMREAANGQNAILRTQDVKAVLDRLEVWNHDPNHALKGKMDQEQIGMTGHSFGALTTQWVSGQQPPRGLPSRTEDRIRAALPMSPSSPAIGNLEQAFGEVKIPWLLMTGTRDDARIGNQTVESRLRVFPSLPPGQKYQVVLFEAEHSAFSERPLPGDRIGRNPNHHRVILALSTAFWDATLKNDAAAKAWLEGEGPRTILEAEDRWEKK